MFPNNTDATFRRGTRKPKPSHLLLHYTYGAAVVKHWGQNKDVFMNRPNIPRPMVSVEAPRDAPKVISDRSKTTAKLDKARGLKTDAQDGAPGGPADSVEGDMYDEDDIMLFFWGNSKAATERHRKKEEDRVQHIHN